MDKKKHAFAAIEWEEKKPLCDSHRRFAAAIPLDCVSDLEFLQTDIQSSLSLHIEPYTTHHLALGPEPEITVTRHNLLCELIRTIDEVQQKLKHLRDREAWAGREQKTLAIDFGPHEQCCRDCGSRTPPNLLNYVGQCRGCANAAASEAREQNW